jgi:hypothetical protein
MPLFSLRLRRRLYCDVFSDLLACGRRGLSAAKCLEVAFPAIAKLVFGKAEIVRRRINRLR